MALRRQKRLRGGMVLLAAALCLGFLVLCWRLPALLERRVLDALDGRGFQESRLQVTSVGFTRSDFTALRTAADAWQFELDRGRAHYRPLTVLRDGIELLELEGLRVEWNIRPAPTAIPPAAAPLTALLEALPSRLPLRSATVSKGTLALRGVGQTRALPFTARLSTDRDAGAIEGLVAIRGTSDWIRLEGRLEPAGDSRLSVAFDLRDPAAWLELLPAWPAPADPDSIHWGPWSGTLGIHIPPRATDATVTASIEPFRLTVPEGRARTARITGEARVRAAGLPELRLHSAFEWVGNSGVRLSAPDVALELVDLARLSARVSDLRIQYGDETQVAGDCHLTVEDVRAGPDAAVTLEFQLADASLPGLSLEPFHGRLQGDRKRLEFSIPELIVPFQGRWRLSGVSGELQHPLDDHARVLLRGQVDGAWFTHLLAPEPLSFELRAERHPDRIIAALELSLDRVVIPALAAPETTRLAGDVALTAELNGGRTNFGARLELGLPRIGWVGGTMSDTTLTGEIGLQLGASPVPPLPRLLKRLDDLWPGWSSGGFAIDDLDLVVKGGDLSLTNGLTLTKPRLRLRRSPTGASEPTRWAELEASVTAIAWNGLEVADLGCLALIDEDQLRVAGAVSWLGERCPFTIELGPVETPVQNGSLTAHFTIGPWNAHDVRLPERFAGGNEIRLTGQAALKGALTLHREAPPELDASIELEFALIDWPARKTSLQNARATIALSGLQPWLASIPADFTADRVSSAGQEWTNLSARFEWTTNNQARIELVNAQWLGGRLQTAPFLWDWETGDVDLEIRVQGLDLDALSHQIPNFHGTLEGRIQGRIPVARESGRWRILAGRVELDRQVPARLEYEAEGLFTGGLSPGTPRYEQLRMVEDGLKDLRLQDLTVDLYSPATPRTVLAVRLEGLSTTPRAIVPIALNLKVQGDFDQLLRLFESGQIDPVW